MSKRPSGSPLFILYKVSALAGGKGLPLGCSLWSGRGAGAWLQTPPSITGPEMQLRGTEAEALGSSSSPLLQSLSRARTVNFSGVISWAQALVA